jgi:hypothetical protein
VARFHATRRAYPRWTRPAVDPARHRSPALGCAPPHAPARPRRAGRPGPARQAGAIDRAGSAPQLRRTPGGTRGSHAHADEPAQDRAGSPTSSRHRRRADQATALHHRAAAERIDLPARPAGTGRGQPRSVALGGARPLAASAARDLRHRSAHRRPPSGSCVGCSGSLPTSGRSTRSAPACPRSASSCSATPS